MTEGLTLQEQLSLTQASFITGKSLTIAAGQSAVHNVTGSLFVCKESSASFMMQVDDGEKFPFELGLRFRYFNFFKKLTFYNEGATALTLSYYVAHALVEDARLNTLIGRTIILGQQALDTRLVVTEDSLGAGKTLAVGASVSIPGTNASQKRKQIVVSNSDFDNDCHILTSAGELFSVVYPRTSWIKETNATVSVKNPAASTASIVVAIGESYYDV